MMIEEKIKKQLAILAAGIEVEKFGIEFYTRTSACVKDRNGALLLRSLGEDERKHREYLETQMRRLAPALEPEIVEPEQKYISRLPSEVFPLESGETCFALEDEIRTLEIGIQVERSSVEMYTEAADLVTEPETREVLQRLVRWEQSHWNILEENLHSLKRGGTWYGYVPILDG